MLPAITPGNTEGKETTTDEDSTPALVAMTIRDTPEGEPRTMYVERAELERLVVAVIDAALPGLRHLGPSPGGARPRIPIGRKAELLGVEIALTPPPGDDAERLRRQLVIADVRRIIEGL